MTGSIYLDYAATTPVDPLVVAAMTNCLTGEDLFGNPASQLHEFGRKASTLVENARAQVAALIGAAADEIIWTSGATEADNLAVIGAARFRAVAGRRIVTSVTEHPAVLDACRYLEQTGFDVVRLQPNEHGIIHPAQVAAALTPETTLVSLMHVNNEIGVVQDIAAIGQLCRDNGSWFHVDAAQSAAWLALDVRSMCIDLLSLSAQKMYGPKGVGALYLNAERARRVEPLMFGGSQERRLRPGTVPTHQVVGMGAAAELVKKRRQDEVERVTAQRDQLRSKLLAVPGVLLNGDAAHCASHIVSVSVTGVEGESLHFALDGLAVSAGSACATLESEPSTVLRCLGRSDQLARASVRFSLGRQTTDREIEMAGEVFATAVQHVRQMAPQVAEAMAMTGNYNDRVRQYFYATDYVGSTTHRCEWNVQGEAGSRHIGTHVVFAAGIDDGVIVELKFRAFGCPHTLAACALAAEQLSGRPAADLGAYGPVEIADGLEVPAEKTGRLLIIEDALRKCGAAWDNRGLA